MAPCHRCGWPRSGRGQGWCRNPLCRQAEKEENLRRKSEEKSARQQQRAAQRAGSRGPLPVAGSTRAQRQELQAERAEEGVGTRGPTPGRGGRPEEEDSTRAQRRDLQAERAEEGAGTRGPTPGRGGRPEEEDSTRVQRRELQAARAEEGVGGRGPRPIATDAEQRGYPFPDEEALSPEQVQERYLAFTRSWGRFGLSRLCAACYTLAPAKHCRKSPASEKMLCRNCRERNTKFLLPFLPPIPEALQQLQPI